MTGGTAETRWATQGALPCIVVACIASGIGACIQFSPFETDLADDEQDLTRKNLERLAASAPPAGPWRFAVLSDSHLAYDELHDIVDALNSRGDIELVVHLGDMTALGLRQEYRNTRAILDRLAMPYLTAIGNHEALSNGRQLYAAMFGPYDYSFRYGGIKFLVYNANQPEFDQDLPNLAWLDSEASDLDGDRGVIACSHRKPAARTLEVLERHHVLGALAGHTHHRSWLDGTPIRYVVDTAEHRAYAVIEVGEPRLTILSCVGGQCAEEPL